MITEEELKRLEELERKATPGPWDFDLEHKARIYATGPRHYYGHQEEYFEAVSKARIDQDFINLSRNLLPRLLQGDKAQRDLIQHLKDAASRDVKFNSELIAEKDRVIADLQFCLKSTEEWNDKLEKENEKMRECLHFYACIENYDMNFQSCEYSKVAQEEGESARKCLKEVGCGD